MKRSSLLIATFIAFGLGACGEQQKPAPKAPVTQPAKPEAAAPTPAAEPAKPVAEAPKPDAAAPAATAAPAAPAADTMKK